MSSKSTLFIYPCPFSKNYGIPENSAWLLLKIYLVYRFILASLFLILFNAQTGPALLGMHDAELYRYSTVIYLVLTIFLAVCSMKKCLGYGSLAQTSIFTDIIIIPIVMHACGGINSGMGSLLGVSIAAGGLLIGGRCSILFAALASLAILSEQVYADQSHAFVTTAYTYAGMLGATFFTIALLAHVLAGRAEEIQRRMTEKQQDIHTLEELNQYIIQHLQSGIIISNQQQQIKMLNHAALTLLNTQNNPRRLIEISAQLSFKFQQWLNAEQNDLASLLLANNNEVQLRFSSLNTRHDKLYMITLEDNALYNQRLQQGKLVSLGRLTASIAHEIRNPLGAISHAEQLLAESPDLPEQDLRLLKIIRTHTQRVNQIIEDILQLSRRKESHRKKVNLQLWLESFLEGFNQSYCSSQKAITLIVDEHIADVYIDEGHLKQILDNLCQNALKYGNNNLEPPFIKLSSEANYCFVDIIDTGLVLDKKIQQHLFEPFFTTSTTGTGLGLYISRELAELNQAKLSYYPTEARKSCFRLCLPNTEQTMIEL